MNIAVHFTVAVRAAEQAATCGVVIVDQASARPIHEAGYNLPWPGSAHAVAVAALIQALQAACELHPQTIDIRCDNELLVRQMTGGASTGDPTVNELIERASLLLLQTDTWRIGTLEPGQGRRPGELAERAMQEATTVTDLDPQQAATRHGRASTGVPQWTVALLEEPGPDCPARCRADHRYPLGPDTPAGLCVYAATAALNDGPLHWTDPEQEQMTTFCPECEVPLRITRVG